MFTNNNQKYVAVAAAAALLVAGGIYMSRKPAPKQTVAPQEILQRKDSVSHLTEEYHDWHDPHYEENSYLTKIEAAKRFAVVQNVEYKLSLALRSSKKTYHGHQ
jgi:hypothetical protein